MKQSKASNLNSNLNKNINPWTNKAKVRGEGLLNSILGKYLNDGDDDFYSTVNVEEKQYEMIAQKIKQKWKVKNKIDSQFKKLFELKERCEKIDQILQWNQKVSNKSYQKSQQNTEKVAIDSSFIYLPAYCGAVFHEIIKDCTAKDKRKNIGAYRNQKLKQTLEQLSNMQDLNHILQKNIL